MSKIPECLTKKYSSEYSFKYIGEVSNGHVYLSVIPLSRSGGFVDVVRDNKIIESYTNLEASTFLTEKFQSIED